MLYARQAFANFAQKFSAEGDTRIAVAAQGPQVRGADFIVTTRWSRTSGSSSTAERVKIDEAAFAEGPRVHHAMIRFEIDIDLFGGASDARRPAGAVRLTVSARPSWPST